jgi:DNA-binding transcriptional MerR regulator
MKRARTDAPTRVDDQTIDWEVHRGTAVLGIRDREVRERVDAILSHFEEHLDDPVRRWMRGDDWDRENLEAVLRRKLDRLPVADVLAALPDKWIRRGRFLLGKRERGIVVAHMVDHLVRGLATDFVSGRLTDARVEEHSDDLMTWFRLMEDSNTARFTQALARCVPRMLYSVEDGVATPLALVGQMAKRPHGLASTVEAAVDALAKGLVRVSPPDPHSSWSWMWRTGLVADGVAVMADEPFRHALSDFLGTNVKQGRYDALMSRNGERRNQVALHNLLAAKRRPPGCPDVTGRLSHQLADIYKANPTFDERPREAIVDAVLEETQGAMLVCDGLAHNYGDARLVVGSWMDALGVEITPALYALLDMIPTMRRDMHLATVVAMLEENTKRTRAIEQQNQEILEQNREIKEQLARAEARAEEHHEAVMEGQEAIHGAMTHAPPAALSPLERQAIAALHQLFVLVPDEKLSSAEISAHIASFNATHADSPLAFISEKLRARLLRTMTFEPDKKHGQKRGWKHIAIRPPGDASKASPVDVPSSD